MLILEFNMEIWISMNGNTLSKNSFGIFMIAISVSKIVIDHSDWETMGHYNILKTNIDYFSHSKLSTL